MEVLEAMLQRRSIRKFKDTKVKEEEITKLLESAMSGPSACNKCCWEFYVVTKEEVLEGLEKVCRYSNYQAPLKIVVAANTNFSITKKENDYWIQDLSAACENILLCAVSLGLGGCWCGIYPQQVAMKRTINLLNLSENIVPFALLNLGVPAEEKEPRTQYDMLKIHKI